MNWRAASISIVGLLIINMVVWGMIVQGSERDELMLYFLDVGQGDSQLITLPGDVDVLIDGGPDQSAARELARVLPPNDRYIDVVIATHPQADHIGGLIDVLERYDVGVVVTNGRRADVSTYERFEDLISEKNIPAIVLGDSDTITYGDARFDVLAPTPELERSSELNDSSLVIRFSAPETSALYTGDAGFATEYFLETLSDISADILKVGHHGSKYASSNAFLSAVRPRVAVIGVGENSYGHPTPETLSRLKTHGAQTFTTRDHGTLRILVRDGKLVLERVL